MVVAVEVMVLEELKQGPERIWVRAAGAAASAQVHACNKLVQK